MSEKAKLHYKGEVFELPIVKGSEDEFAIDVSSLRQKANVITLYRGFKILRKTIFKKSNPCYYF